jgi:hypothetical protein
VRLTIPLARSSRDRRGGFAFNGEIGCQDYLRESSAASGEPVEVDLTWTDTVQGQPPINTKYCPR